MFRCQALDMVGRASTARSHFAVLMVWATSSDVARDLLEIEPACWPAARARRDR
jgi:hypothetical protein